MHGLGAIFGADEDGFVGLSIRFCLFKMRRVGLVVDMVNFRILQLAMRRC